MFLSIKRKLLHKKIKSRLPIIFVALLMSVAIALIFISIGLIRASTIIGTNISTTGTFTATSLSTLGNASTTILSVSGNAYLNGNVGVGTNAPTYTLTVQGAVNNGLAVINQNNDLITRFDRNTDGAGRFKLWDENGNTKVSFVAGGAGFIEGADNFFELRDGSQVSYLTTATGELIINDDSNSGVDFRAEGDTDANLLFIDASADKVGIGVSSPSEKLHVEEGSILLNNSSSSVGDLFLKANSQNSPALYLCGLSLPSTESCAGLRFDGDNKKMGTVGQWQLTMPIWDESGNKFNTGYGFGGTDGTWGSLISPGLGNVTLTAATDLTLSANRTLINKDDSSSEWVVFDSDNEKVGIGSSTPSEKLDVAGNMVVGDTANGTTTIQFATGDTNRVLGLGGDAGFFGSPAMYTDNNFVITNTSNFTGFWLGTGGSQGGFVNKNGANGPQIFSDETFFGVDGNAVAIIWDSNQNGFWGYCEGVTAVTEMNGTLNCSDYATPLGFDSDDFYWVFQHGGSNDAQRDLQIVWDGETNKGLIKYWEDEDQFEFKEAVSTGKYTADPCGTLLEGAMFYNDTSDYYCFCTGAGNDVQMHDPLTPCF